MRHWRYRSTGQQLDRRPTVSFELEYDFDATQYRRPGVSPNEIICRVQHTHTRTHLLEARIASAGKISSSLNRPSPKAKYMRVQQDVYPL